jgi:hypothetical protein
MKAATNLSERDVGIHGYEMARGYKSSDGYEAGGGYERSRGYESGVSK